MAGMSDDAERQFDEMSAWVAEALGRARGDRAAEEAVLEEAARRYVAARTLVDPDDPASYAGHFFGADGVGFERGREPGLQRIAGATPDDLQRWAEFVAAAAERAVGGT